MGKKEVRFGVGSPDGQYSMLWRAWVQGDEIYLAPRSMANLIKMSLHSSGIWRWAFVGGSVIDKEVEGDRAQGKWLKPSPFFPGWVAGPSVMFPSSPVEGWEGDPVETEKAVSWLDPPREGEKVTVSLMIGEPGVIVVRDLSQEKKFPVLAEIDLRSGGRVWVAARRDPMTTEEIRGVAAVQEEGVDAEVVGYGGTSIRLVESNGVPLFVEMRVPKRRVSR